MDTILSDPRVRGVPWRDLTRLARSEVTCELLLSAPWLMASLGCAYIGLHGPALAFSFVFFLTGLRQVHGAHHYTLGLPRWATEWVMFGLSVLMLGSMHAIQVNHLRHHQHLMSDDDVEALSARLQWWQALLIGPVFPIVLHVHALRLATARQRRWIAGELCANVAVVASAFVILDAHVLRYHVVAMAVGQCLTAFFAVWTVHHDCDRYHYIARTIRGRLKGRVTFNMFFHVEHHLYPGVPTCRLAMLAERLDAVAPELNQKRVF